MNTPLAAGIFGVTVAAVVCFFLVRYLRALSDEIALLPFMAICVGIGLACLAIAWLWERKDAARKERERSSQQ